MPMAVSLFGSWIRLQRRPIVTAEAKDQRPSQRQREQQSVRCDIFVRVMHSSSAELCSRIVLSSPMTVRRVWTVLFVASIFMQFGTRRMQRICLTTIPMHFSRLLFLVRGSGAICKFLTYIFMLVL